MKTTTIVAMALFRDVVLLVGNRLIDRAAYFVPYFLFMFGLTFRLDRAPGILISVGDP